MSDSSIAFKPEMCHQIYGDNENVFGYRGLKVGQGWCVESYELLSVDLSVHVRSHPEVLRAPQLHRQGGPSQDRWCDC